MATVASPPSTDRILTILFHMGYCLFPFVLCLPFFDLNWILGFCSFWF